MATGYLETAGPREPGQPRRFLPSQVAIIVAWVTVAASVFAMLASGVRSTDQYQACRHGLHAVYVLALLLYLVRTGPSLSGLAKLDPGLKSHRKWRAWLPVVLVALMLALTAISDDGIDLLLLSLFVASIWILVVWRRRIFLQLVVQGIVVALLAYLAGLPMARNGFAEETTIILLPALAVPMYVAGWLLFEHTRLGGIQLVTGGGKQVLQSFLWGCFLFLPLGMLNAAGGSPGNDISWVTEWWMPLALPWFSGIAEEIWFRLLLVGLCFFMVRPAFSTKPVVAVVVAVLFSGITFGLGHDRTLERFLTTGLLYGVPMAAVFVRRDWEHAVGAHYMVNMIPWLTVFLET